MNRGARMAAHGRIEICGGIASGKTSLARMLARTFQCRPVLEAFRRNPFWKRYYLQSDVFRAEKDVCFLAQHTGEIKAASGPVTVCDYAVIQDLAYAALSRDPGHVELMRHLYRRLYETLPRPTLLIHLRCVEAEQLRRILARGRVEERAIDHAFLADLNGNLETALKAAPAPVLSLRSDEIDFVGDRQQARELRQQVLERFLSLAG
jgi:deoxyguanosine kinase